MHSQEPCQYFAPQTARRTLTLRSRLRVSLVTSTLNLNLKVMLPHPPSLRIFLRLYWIVDKSLDKCNPGRFSHQSAPFVVCGDSPHSQERFRAKHAAILCREGEYLSCQVCHGECAMSNPRSNPIFIPVTPAINKLEELHIYAPISSAQGASMITPPQPSRETSCLRGYKPCALYAEPQSHCEHERERW